MVVSSNHPHKATAPSEEPPPVLGTWRRFYTVVIVNTVLVYFLLYLFSRYAAS